MTKQTDNSHLKEKVALRRYFLQRFAKDNPISVFDACQGYGILWQTLRKEFSCKYFGVDIKKKKGRLRIDSSRVLAQSGWDFDVIDIDTYGEPWAQWFALLPNVTKPVVVFLTIVNTKRPGGGSAGLAGLAGLGLNFKRLKLPGCLACQGVTKNVDNLIACAYKYGLRVVYCAEILIGGKTNMRYIGVVIEPKEIEVPMEV